MKIKILQYIFIVLLAGAAVFPSTSYAQISDNDLLIEKLVDKGYLSEIEATILKDKTKRYVAEHMVEGRLISLPQWVQRIELKGDIRLRTQYEKRKGIDDSRQRGRLRARIGLISRINKHITGGIGITTGSGDSRSGNVTFTDSFDKADIRLDYGFLEYKPFPWVKVVGGKWKADDYIWKPTTLLWDSDINPEGGALHLEKNIGRKVTVFGNAGGLAIDELSASTEDPMLIYGQGGVGVEINDFDAKVAGTFYEFRHLKGKRLDDTACSNSGLTLFGTNCTGSLSHNFRVSGGSVELGYRKMIHEEFKRIAIFGDWFRNDDAPDKINKAWSVGLKFGNQKVKYLGDWQFTGQYSHLEQDAFPDIFPNSNRYEGQTGIKGYDGKLTIGLAPNVTANLSYYHAKKINSDSSLEFPERIYQGDIQVKF